MLSGWCCLKPSVRWSNKQRRDNGGVAAATAAANAAAAADTAAGAGAGTDAGSPAAADENAEEEVLPMIQLASFALHKLFSEWEYEGHKVPQLKPTSGNSVSISVSISMREYQRDERQPQ